MVPSVSIVLPVYNAEKHIHACVKSCLNQSYTEFELLIINDGSTDSTLDILNSFSDDDSRVHVITSPHAGVSTAMNVGMREAKGRYIARMDADDEMHTERLQKQVDFLESHPETGLVSSLVQHGGDPDTQKGYATHIEWINSLHTHEEIFLNRFVDSPVCNPSVMFRSSLVEQHGGALSGDFPEDYEMWLRWLHAGVKFAKIPELLLKWNDPLTRLTRTDARYSPEAFNRVKMKYLVKYIAEHIRDRKLYLCGAGRETRRKSDQIRESNFGVGGYVDVDPNKIGKVFDATPVISLDELPGMEHAYVVSFVGNRGAREEIRRALLTKGFQEGIDFVLAG